MFNMNFQKMSHLCDGLKNDGGGIGPRLSGLLR
jgi:hypothetical protein